MPSSSSRVPDRAGGLPTSRSRRRARPGPVDVADALERLLGPGGRELASLAPSSRRSCRARSGARGCPNQLRAHRCRRGARRAAAGLGQARLFERVLGLIGALSAAGPTILVVEDVHWIDRATRDLLTFVSRNLTTERLAVVLTCRAEDLPRGHPIGAWLAEIERVQPTTVLELERLGRDAVERQLRVIGGGESRPPSRAIRHDRSNPLSWRSCSRHPRGTPRVAGRVLLARVVRSIREPDARGRRRGRGRPATAAAAEVRAIPEAEWTSGLRAALAHGVLEALPSAGGTASGTSSSVRSSRPAPARDPRRCTSASREA